MKMRHGLLAVLLVSGAALAAQAPRANLSGTWKLNVVKSSMGGDHPFADYQLTKTIELKGDVVSITDAAVHNSVVNIPLPDSTTTMEVATDGKEQELTMPPGFPGMPPSKAVVTAEWQGGTLEVDRVVAGMASYSRLRLFLSDDRAQLIELVEQHSTFGDVEQRLVFEKTQ
jgi:hypothetical protein